MSMHTALWPQMAPPLRQSKRVTLYYLLLRLRFECLAAGIGTRDKRMGYCLNVRICMRTTGKFSKRTINEFAPPDDAFTTPPHWRQPCRETSLRCR